MCIYTSLSLYIYIYIYYIYYKVADEVLVVAAVRRDALGLLANLWFI